MRSLRSAAVVAASVVALILLAGCTGESQTAAPASSPTSATSGSPVEEAQASLDEAIAAMNDAGSIAFTTQIDQVVDSNVNEITVTGAWTTEPAAWRSLKTIDRPPSTLAGPDHSIKEIFAGSRLYTRLTVNGKRSIPWADMSHLLAEDGKSREDYESPRAVRLLSLTRATAMSELGGTLSITGTVPSSWALEALELDYHLVGLGFGGRFDDSTTRVLITVGDDGLPQTLRLEGSGVDVSKADLPDYVVEELAQARHFTTYDEADLDDPIEAPRSYVVP